MIQDMMGVDDGHEQYITVQFLFFLIERLRCKRQRTCFNQRNVNSFIHEIERKKSGN